MEIYEVDEVVKVKKISMTEDELNEYIKPFLEKAYEEGYKKGKKEGFYLGRLDFRNELLEVIANFELKLNIAGSVELCKRLINKLKYFTK
jgi:flagellar biosynthesis/type III secretory pathway protein FliH